jgi:hypothetical protein
MRSPAFTLHQSALAGLVIGATGAYAEQHTHCLKKLLVERLLETHVYRRHTAYRLRLDRGMTLQWFCMNSVDAYSES